VAARKPNIAVGIIADTREFERSMGVAAKKVGVFRNTLMANLASNAIMGGLGLLKQGLDSAFDFAAGGLDKFDQLGDATAILDANFAGMGKTIGKLDLTRLGFDKIETAGAAEAIASTAKALGLSSKEAEAVVGPLTKAAAGYSALTGKDAAESGDIFAKALAGSAKAAKELGVEFTKGMTPAQRMQALMAKWGPLADDAANGTRSLADEQATFDAQMSNLQTTVGGFLNSALTPLLAAFNEQFMPALTAFTTENGPAIEAIVTTIGQVFSAVFGFIADEVVPIVMGLVDAIGKALAPVLAKVGPMVESWMPVWKAIFGFIASTVVPILRDFVIPLLGKMLEAFATISTFIGGVFSRAIRALEGPLRTFGNVLRDIIGFIQDIVQKVASAPIIRDFLGFVGGGGSGGSNGRAAQFVGASAPAVIVNFNGLVTDPVRAGREVSRALGSYRSRGGTIAVG
jgi:phage-related protein